MFKTEISWDFMPCGLVNRYTGFVRWSCLPSSGSSS